ncbi:type I phosphomannose isomerase catalytic subunit [Aquimarina agarilytica]|uniref:type I phosphomannose isomerase catalytic subunit n=1 Tax=Aquimarina agarilytica TaxID=1087449 RepID=UPI000288D943|nr:type I phosphomannose isomerase catalytic subunit [Aquimarina agarilytica]
MAIYPLQFTPLYKYRMWGGEKLKTILNKVYTENNIGESWEISAVENDETVVSNGSLQGKTIKELIKTLGTDFLGKAVFEKFGNDFPLLIKFIDAKTPLSIQVHPSDALAKERHNSFGKNEMWYVMQAEENAELIAGFDKKLTKQAYIETLETGDILEVLHTEKVKSGDVFNIPTGRVHAIGAGVLLAEIQQTSDITYRIYDYNRVDAKTGETRELHTEQAVDAIDFKVHDSYKTNYTTPVNKANELVYTPYFKTNILKLEGDLTQDFSKTDSFVIVMCVEGDFELSYDNEKYVINTGSTILLPAAIDQIQLKGNAKILEVSL